MGKIARYTRRGFLLTAGVAGGGLALGIAFSPNRLSVTNGSVAGEGEALVNTWVKLGRDNILTVLVPHAEMGQGVHTALPMMLAEEMDADWDLVRVEQAPALSEFANDALARGFGFEETMGLPHVIPDFLKRAVGYGGYLTADMLNLQVTGGSSSVRFTGQWGMRLAGAAARHMLVAAAAEEWGVAPGSCSTELSHVRHDGSGRRARFGDLAEAAARQTPPSAPTFKPRPAYTIVGTSKPRVDIPAKVDGSARYGIDVDVPGMAYAVLRQSPVFGGTVASFDLESVRGRKGVRTVVEIPGAVAVIGDSYWAAKKAADALDVSFDPGANAAVSNDTIFDTYARDMENSPGASDVSTGHVADALENAADVIEREYRVAFLAHAAMEPMNCTAHVTESACEIWVSTQDPLGARATAAEVAGVPIDNVTVHAPLLGGGFGRRLPFYVDFIEQAVAIAKQVPYPVKLVWSREEDIQHDFYRPGLISKFKAPIDETGMPLAWINQYVDAGQRTNNPPGASKTFYDIPHQDIRRVESFPTIPLGEWRSVAHSHQGFFKETFVDELAVAAGKDPYVFRQSLLANKPRYRRVLDLVASKAEWGKLLPLGQGRGIAMEEAFGTLCAQVAEVSVDEAGALTVHRIVAAVDCGEVIHPDTVEAQIESGIIFGLTAALYGDIRIEGGRVLNENFTDYEMITLATAPKIEVHILDSGERMGGVGEPGTPPAAPAVANAIYNATGRRLRRLPILGQDLLGPRTL